MDNEKLERFFSDESTEEEISEIHKWVEESAEHNTAFSNAYKRYVMTSLAVLRSVHNEETARKTAAEGGKSRRGLILRIVAGTLSAAAVLVAGVFIGDRMSGDTSNRSFSISAEAGQRANVTLADGTKVILNSGSTLEYPTSFTSRQRKVRLDGEAMFDVTSDRKHPFVVETGQYDVKVLGTKFDVIADNNTGMFTTALLEGKVNITDKSGKELAVLRPEQKITIENGAVLISEIKNPEEECQWTDGIISVAGQPFDKIMKKISRSYGVKIRIERDNIPVLRFSYLKLRVSDGVEHALKSLQRGAEFTYVFDDSTEEYIIR
ncbi:MAG: FecR family protein [Candidatus Cryptobacteroides sp.]